MTIPIANLYYLLCYAWNRLDEGEIVSVADLPSTETVDLFAHVLCQGVSHVVRRGVDRGYEARTDVIAGLRGRLNIAPTLRRQLLAQGRADCSFDELTHDTLANRLVKTTLNTLVRTRGLAPELHATAVGLLRRFGDVSDVRVTASAFHRVQLHRNNAYYGFLLDVCRVIHRQSLVDRRTGEVKFRDFVRDEMRMRQVFEAFLFNFYRRHLVGHFKVRRELIDWRDLDGAPDDLAYFPRMITDVVLTSPERKVVIDAKYYAEALKGRFRRHVSSANVYQMAAYLGNVRTEAGQKLAGILIYPETNAPLALDYRLNGVPLAVRTVDLKAAWPDIEAQLLSFVAG